MKNTGLYRSARKGNIAEVKEYLGSQAHVLEMLSEEHRTLLHFTVEDQYPDICKLFLDHANEAKIIIDGSSFVEVVDENNKTALTIAIEQEENLETVKMIILSTLSRPCLSRSFNSITSCCKDQ